MIGAVGLVNTPSLKTVVFINGLVIKVAAVNQEEYFVNPSVITKQGCQFITRKRLTGAGGMEDIS